MQPLRITSRDNPLLVRIRQLARDASAYRKAGQVWLEGDHLCRAALHRGRTIAHAVATEAALEDPAVAALAWQAARLAVVPRQLFTSISGLDSPASIGFLMALPAEAPPIDPHAASVVLDRVQDPGNAGSILRSAAAFGVTQVIALKGTAALWSPKLLRAAMGAHFGLRLVEGLDAADLEELQVPFIATSPHARHALAEASLPWPCAWVLGHEGQGVDERLQQRCAMTVRIPQPGGEESLNVAAAAAVCMYESLRQRGAPPVSIPAGRA